MKKQQVNNKLYKLSETLYGAERFKIELEAIKESEISGRCNPDDIPEICLKFSNQREVEDYQSIVLSFYLCNFTLIPQIEVAYRSFLGYILARHSIEESTFEKLKSNIISMLDQFFGLEAAIDCVIDIFGVDLLTPRNRANLIDWNQFIYGYYEVYSKISDPKDRRFEYFKSEGLLIFERFHDVAGIDSRKFKNTL